MLTFIYLVVLMVPAVLLFFWLQAFGFALPTKRSSIGTAFLSVVLWIPTLLIVVFTYNILAVCIELYMELFQQYVGLHYVNTLYSLDGLLSSFVFITFYFVTNVFYSFWVAKLFVRFYPRILKLVNKTRQSRGLPDLTDER
ncbi:hypothetical protein [Longirhabdus pacifica]|uniref:hypothetical protein n=1 Tax=Longirhabdus pacifica TaxID=2305227 RepID=UPI0013E8DB0A|nr:hypothetical protein [Longirhabdus pacifica]